ncbi:MAG: membrane protein insertase YidC [Bauldia sp.]|nr:membrane protein insertase YidC [Bauldia sp.]
MTGNNRNFIIAIGLSILVLILWQVFVANPQIDQAQQEVAAQQVAAGEANTIAADADTPLPAGAVTATPDAAARFETRDAAVAATNRVPIQTERVSGSINLTGGVIDDLRLLDYRETVEPDSPTIVLLSPASGPDGYLADFGWSRSGGSVVDGNTVWTAPAGTVLTPETPVTLTFDNGAGLVFNRVIAIDRNFMFTVTDTVVNGGAGDAAIAPYGRIRRLGEPEATGFFILHEGMIGAFGDQGLQQVDYAALETEASTYDPTTEGWLGITDKYWAVTLIPEQGRSFTGTFRRETGGALGLRYQADYIGELVTVPAGGTATVTNHLFAGAKEVSLINAYRDELSLERFDFLVDWGWFHFITRPMFWFLDALYQVVGNFGIAILLVTVFLKLVFFPLANRSYRSMASMRKVTPQITALRERYKDDRAKQQQAMLELYRKEKINPIAGCWPVLIQIPVFFALYKVLFVTIEMRHAPFFGWIQDLSAPDPTSFLNLFGLLPFEAPVFLQIGIWPIIMGITMWVQFQLNPQTPGTPRWIFSLLPVVFTFMLSSFPAGLVIYWAWNNFLSVLQQGFIMRRNGVEVNLLGNIRSTFRRKPKEAVEKAKKG